ITRTTGWRISRATPPIVVGLLLAPVLFIVPPHVPWSLGALGGGLAGAIAGGGLIWWLIRSFG
ncbi:MAG: hypothetical protein ACO3SJ_06155, partial [Phycisphaerales bacterium]